MRENDEKLKSIMEHLSHWGFKFQSYDENGMPLVVAPNGQIVEINIAIKFVNEEIAKKKDDASGGFEKVTDNVDEAIGTNIETKTEREVELNKPKENSNNSGSDLQVKIKAPQVKLAEPVKLKPYGDGYDPKSFDPTNDLSTQNFVTKNVKKSNQSSSKWLAIQFRKFLEENRIQSK